MVYELFFHGDKIEESNKLSSIVFEIYGLMHLGIMIGFGITVEDIQDEIDKNGIYIEDEIIVKIK